MTDVKVMTNEDIKDEAKIQQEKDLKALMNTIVQLKQLEGLNIDLLGSWLWIGGNTKENKDYEIIEKIVEYYKVNNYLFLDY